MRGACLVVVIAACAGPRPAPPLAPIAGDCRARPPATGQAPWHWTASLTCASARAVDGGRVELDGVAAVLRRSNPDGSQRWRASILDEHGGRCGAPSGLAIGADGAVVLGCGDSLIRFDPDGARRWQIWPAGDHHVGAPVIDVDGTSYVTAGGALHAIAPDGTSRWQASFGFGFSASAIGVADDGDFLLDLTEDVWFGDDDTAYHPDGPPTLVRIDRTGRIVDQHVRTSAEPWPRWIPIVDDGGRLPPR